MGPRNLSAAVRHYCGRELEGAHSAEADTQATIDVLLAQLHRHPQLPKDVQGLHDFCSKNTDRNRDDEPAGAKGAGGASA
jgi:DNA polymerase-3 subunit epsilon